MIGLSITVNLVEPTSQDKKGNSDSETGTGEDGIESIG